MAKLTLTDLASLTNQTTAINSINDNNTRIEIALEKTLSRDGTTPNTMGSSLDMNSNHIINLPAPGTDLEPLRLIDFNSQLAVHGANLVTPGTTTNNALVKWSSSTGLSVANSGILTDSAGTSLTIPVGLSVPTITSDTTYTGK